MSRQPLRRPTRPSSVLTPMFLPGEAPIFPSLMDQSNLSRSDIEEKPTISESPRDPATNKYSCNRCGRSYLHQATLVRHQRYECGLSASHPCQLCGKKFKRRDVLKGHMEKCMSKSSSSSPNCVLLYHVICTLVRYDIISLFMALFGISQPINNI